VVCTFQCMDTKIFQYVHYPYDWLINNNGKKKTPELGDDILGVTNVYD